MRRRQRSNTVSWEGEDEAICKKIRSCPMAASNLNPSILKPLAHPLHCVRVGVFVRSTMFL